MTAAETLVEPQPEVPAHRSPWRPYAAFGTGVALEIRGDNLEVAVVRVQPSGVVVIARASIANFHHRPAAEWSREYQEAVRGHGEGAVIVLLPRREVIVRHLTLPGVPKREIEGALALRLRSLHPFAEDDVAWCWMPVRNGVLAGFMRLSVLGRYEELFAEAGIPVAGFTFSAAVAHSASRLYGDPALPVLAISEPEPGRFEIYGENASGSIYSGEFQGSPTRAHSVAVAELRLSQSFEAVDFRRLIPGADAEDARPLLVASAVASACPLLVRAANFLPPERRAGQSRLWLVPTLILGALLVLAVIAAFAVGPYRDKRYRDTLRQEIAAVEPTARRAASLDRRIAASRAQIALLDGVRGRSQADFEILNELTRLIAPPAFVTLIEIYPDAVVLSGEGEQAAPLLKILDSSPLFRNSEFSGSVARSAKNEVFRIRTLRRSPR